MFSVHPIPMLLKGMFTLFLWSLNTVYVHPIPIFLKVCSPYSYVLQGNDPPIWKGYTVECRGSCELESVAWFTENSFIYF